MRDLLNCPNCGAAIKGAKCEYCGTQFYDLADMSLNERNYLRVRINDKIYLISAFLANIKLTFKDYGTTELEMGFYADKIQEVKKWT